MKEINRAFVDPNFLTWLGMRLLDQRPGAARLELPVRPEFIQISGAVHGGIVATIADAALACAVLSELGPGITCSTIEMKVNYLAPIRSGTMIADATLIRRGTRIAVSRADIVDGSGTLIATAMGTFKIQTVQPNHLATAGQAD